MRLVLMALLLGAPDGGPPATEGRRLPATPSGTTLRLVVGKTLRIRLPCVPKGFYAGNDPYDLHPLGGDMVELIGLQPGRSTLLGWCEDGSRVRYPLTIVAP
jgi:hypothetical protein